MDSKYILASASTNENEQTRATDTINDIRKKIVYHNVHYFVLNDNNDYAPVLIMEPQLPFPKESPESPVLKNRGVTEKNAIFMQYLRDKGKGKLVGPHELFVKKTPENSGGGAKRSDQKRNKKSRKQKRRSVRKSRRHRRR
jgi:hypothetical protein